MATQPSPRLAANTLAMTETPEGLVARMLKAIPNLTITPGTIVVQYANPRQLCSYQYAHRTVVPNPPDPITHRPAGGYGFPNPATGVSMATGRCNKTDIVGDATLIGNFVNSPEEYSDNLGVQGQLFCQPIATLIGTTLSRMHDGCSLKFRFTPTQPVFQFSFYFTSYEYDEFIGSAFTDAFVALLDGVNIALLPGTSTYISINTVNYIDTPLWFSRYSGNNDSSGFQQVAGDGLVCDNRAGYVNGYDGLGNWLPVVVTANMTANVEHEIEFIICDVTDGNYESAVFFPTATLGARTPCTNQRHTPVIGA